MSTEESGHLLEMTTFERPITVNAGESVVEHPGTADLFLGRVAFGPGEGSVKGFFTAPSSDPAQPFRYRRGPTLSTWAIRRRTDGAYLPDRLPGYAKGYSFLEPVAPTEVERPRLFHSERSAKAALAQWLKGHYVRVHAYKSTADWFQDDESDSFEWRPVPTRRAEDMEVVSLPIQLPYHGGYQNALP